MKYRAVQIITVVIYVLLGGCHPIQLPEKETGEQPETAKAITFTIPALNQEQQEIDLAAFNGQVVLLDFLASWDLPCQSELPALDALYKDLKDKGFALVGLTVDKGTIEEIGGAVARLELVFPVGLAGEDIQAKYGGIRAIPTKFLLDKKGIVRQKYVGVVSDRQLRADIESLLAE